MTARASSIHGIMKLTASRRLPYRASSKDRKVLLMPEWLACKSWSTGLTAGMGRTMRRESSRTRPSEMDREAIYDFKDLEYVEEDVPFRTSWTSAR